MRIGKILSAIAATSAIIFICLLSGCYEGHAHYMMAEGMNIMGGPAPTINTTVEQFNQMAKDSYAQAKAAGKMPAECRYSG